MTTIAYCKGVMAADSRVTRKDVIDEDNVRKLYRLQDGTVCGWAGRQDQGELLIRALKYHVKKGDKKLPQVMYKCQLLLATKKKVFLYDGGYWEQIDRPYAIGSGAPYAKVALDLGHDAVTAVKAGISKDVYSGGKIRSLKV